MKKLKIKRVYEQRSENDGYRVLVDRLWPRGIKKEAAGIDLWLKDIAPSAELRKWFGHKPEKWKKFKEKYFEELESNSGLNELIKTVSSNSIVTFVYSAKEENFNNAVALLEFIENYISPER